MLSKTYGFLVILAAILIALYESALSYRMDVDEENFCRYRQHLTVKPKATCCRNKVVVPGIDVTEKWSQCAQGDGVKQATTIEDVGWAMYACILQNANGGKEEISLKDFAELMTANYPDAIKTDISTEIGKQTTPSTKLTDVEKLDDIRMTYYDIETAICQDKTLKSYREEIVNLTKFYGLEENHRGGMWLWCTEKALPVDVLLKSSEQIQTDEKKLEECMIEKLQPELKKLNLTEVIEANIMEICQGFCDFYVLNHNFPIVDDLIKNTHYWDFNVSIELNKGDKVWFPNSVINSDLITEAKGYVDSIFSIRNTTNEFLNYTFADNHNIESNTHRPNHFVAFTEYFNKTNETVPFATNFTGFDFARRKFQKEIIHIPILCSAYTSIIKLMEYAVFYRPCRE